MHRLQLRAFGAAVSIFFAGCTDSVAPAVPSCGDAGCGWQPVVTSSFEDGRAVYSSVQPIDLLFVIDDTPPIAGIAANLVAQYSMFAQVFQALPFGAPPMHVAFVPATLPSSECSPPALRGAVCSIAPPDQFLTVDYCGVNQSTSGSLGDAFACLGNFGAQGCGTSQPLEAARRALGGDPSGGGLTGLTGFVRPGARLQIVFVTAGDDASIRDDALAPVSDYLAFFRSLTADPDDDFLVSLIGPEGCTAGAPVAEALTPRLDQMVGFDGLNGVSVSICDASLTRALVISASQLGILILPPCIDGIKDTDPTQPGLQPDCFVDAKVTGADGSETAIELSVCDPEAPVPPCLSFLPADSPLNDCPPGGQRPTLLFAADPVTGCMPYAAQVRVTCLSCSDPTDPACAGQ